MVRCIEGIADNVCVRIGNSYVPTDFEVLNTGYGNEAPIILGRPFLHTANTTIFTGTAEIYLHLDTTLRSPFQPHPKPPKRRPCRKNKQAEGHRCPIHR
jgi:hypothetical protein